MPNINSKIIRARCSPELKEKLAEYCRRFEQTEGNIVRRAVIEFLARQPSVSDAFIVPERQADYLTLNEPPRPSPTRKKPHA